MKIKAEQADAIGSITTLYLISRLLEVLEEEVTYLHIAPETQAQFIKLKEIFDKETETIVEDLVEKEE